MSNLIIPNGVATTLRRMAAKFELYQTRGIGAYREGNAGELLSLLASAYEQDEERTHAQLDAMLFCEHCDMPRQECICVGKEVARVE